MRILREFNRFLDERVVKKQVPDKSRSQDLFRDSERKFEYLKVILNKIGISELNTNDIIEDCYDILIRLIRAKMLLDGFSASGAGAHEAEVSYLRKLNFNEAELDFMNQLRYFRNGIMYYGKRFDKEYAEKVLRFLEKTYLKLKDILKLS